jgi:hypothetical protein
MVHALAPDDFISDKDREKKDMEENPPTGQEIGNCRFHFRKINLNSVIYPPV